MAPLQAPARKEIIMTSENDYKKQTKLNKQVNRWFEKHNDEFLKFEKIPNSDLRHPRPDLCAMLYLHERFGGLRKAVASAEHDQIWLAWEAWQLTEADVIYLTRCGVMYEEGGLSMFV